MEKATGDAPLLFDHTRDDAPPPVSTRVALRCLLGLLQFTPGGLVKVFKTSDSAGPLANTAAVIPWGASLGASLLLSLHPPGSAGIPPWEKEPPSLAQIIGGDILPAGWTETYTWLTRSVLLVPEEDTGKSVRWIRFGAGVPRGANTSLPEPMAGYIQGKNSRYPLSFREGRAFWRDLPALIPDQTSKQDLHPQILNEARTMLEEVGEEAPLHVLVAGLSSSKAKLLRWNNVSFRLPESVLDATSDASIFLRKVLGHSEETGSQLVKLLYALIATAYPHSRVGVLAKSLPTSQVYFAHLETQVPVVLACIADGDTDGASIAWTKAQIQAVTKAWQATRAALGDSLPVFKAAAIVGRAFGKLVNTLKKNLPEAEQTMEDAHEQRPLVGTVCSNLLKRIWGPWLCSGAVWPLIQGLGHRRTPMWNRSYAEKKSLITEGSPPT